MRDTHRETERERKCLSEGILNRPIGSFCQRSSDMFAGLPKMEKYLDGNLNIILVILYQIVFIHTLLSGKEKAKLGH